MTVKRRTIDARIECRILTGMIVSTAFLRNVIDIYKPEYMKMDTSPIIAGWCVDFFKKYEKAPGAHIEDVFHKWAEDSDNDEQIEYIEGFLSKLSEDYENEDKFNDDVLLDRTIDYFRKESLLQLSKALKFAVEHGDDTEEAEMLLYEHKRIEKLLCDSVDPFEDKEAMMEAFEESMEPLFRMPGKLGAMINDQLTRDSFIALMAPEKRGKTWWLKYFAMRAYRDRCNVAVFQVGDMSKNQYIRRIGIHVAKKSDKRKYCTDLWVPVSDCQNNQTNECKRNCKSGIFDTDGNRMKPEDATRYTPCSNNAKSCKHFRPSVWKIKVDDVDPLTWREAFRCAKEFKSRVKGKSFKISTHPSDTLNVRGIKNILRTWERVEGFIPDVIVIDYADILAPEDGAKEPRQIENKRWMALRGLSQELHCCVITATQADAASYGQKTIKRSNFSEDKRKYAHVTALYALNQTEEEKEFGIMRVGAIVVREEAFNENYNVNVAQCLEQGQPCLFSW